MMSYTYSLALNKSSMLFCILGLGITLVLFQEQRKLVGSDSVTAVSITALTTSQIFVINLRAYQGWVSGYPQYKLRFPADCHCSQPATGIIHLGTAPFYDPGFLDDVLRSAHWITSPCHHSCSSRASCHMRGYMDSPSPMQESCPRHDGPGTCCSFYSHFRERSVYGRSHGLSTISTHFRLSNDTTPSRCMSTYGQNTRVVTYAYCEYQKLAYFDLDILGPNRRYCMQVKPDRAAV
jgi:hypothetical protein